MTRQNKSDCAKVLEGYETEKETKLNHILLFFLEYMSCFGCKAGGRHLHDQLIDIIPSRSPPERISFTVLYIKNRLF